MLRELSEHKRREFYESMIGKNAVVLFEERNDEGKIKGFTSNYVRVEHAFNSDLVNQLVNVKISGVKDNVCSVELIEKETKKLAI